MVKQNLDNCFNYDALLFIIVSTLLMALPASYEPHHFAKALFVTATVISLAYSVLILWFTKLFVRLRTIILVFLFVLFIVETYSYITFNSRLNPSIMTLIFQTSPKEISEFFIVYVFTKKTLLFVLFITSIVVIYFFLYRKMRRFVIRHTDLFKWCSAFAVLNGVLIHFIPFSFPLGQNTVNELCISIRFLSNKHGEIALMEEMIDNIEVYSAPDKEEAPVVVFVIGESFNKYHSNLYGYRLKTSPRLTAERDSGNLIIFNKANTPTNGTAYAMRYLFSQQGCEYKVNDYDSLKYVLMPAVFKKANYEVVYIDNQYTRSSGGTFDYSCGYFLNPKSINDFCFDYRNTETAAYDGDFIMQHQSFLSHHKRSLNIIHLMGQHFDAAQRYPDNFKCFTEENIDRQDLSKSERSKIAHYDNATLYNDYVLSQIINLFCKDEAVVVYVSDHGEQIYDGPEHYFGRTFGSIKDKTSLLNVYQVPLMIWFSDSYRLHHSDLVSTLQQRADVSFCIADLPYLLYDLGCISFNFHQPKRSIADKDYRQHVTQVRDD